MGERFLYLGWLKAIAKIGKPVNKIWYFTRINCKVTAKESPLSFIQHDWITSKFGEKFINTLTLEESGMQIQISFSQIAVSPLISIWASKLMNLEGENPG